MSDVETPETTSDAPVRPCSNCGTGMERRQDWCLECGTAAPGRLGDLRPGWRAVTTTLALTLVLLGGAGAASYAALNSDPNREALADAAPAGPAVAAVPPPATGPTVPAIPVAPRARKVPAVTPPATKLPVAPKVSVPKTPVTPATTAKVTPPPPVAVPARPKVASTPEPSTTTPERRGAGTSVGGGGRASDAPLEPIALGAGALALYDPAGRAVSPSELGSAFDGDADTAFEVGAPDDGEPMQVGVVVDLGSVKKVRGVEITTQTPGVRIEVYAADGSLLPPDIADTRWDHPASIVGADGVERARFPKNGDTYRYVTLWFTTPPTDGTKAGLSEIKVLG